jgi:hypothetical protein
MPSPIVGSSSIKGGFPRRSADYQKVTDVMVAEPFLNRIIYHTGSLEIDSAGTNRENIVLNHVERPYEIKKKLNELRVHH